MNKLIRLLTKTLPTFWEQVRKANTTLAKLEEQEKAYYKTRKGTGVYKKQTGRTELEEL